MITAAFWIEATRFGLNCCVEVARNLSVNAAIIYPHLHLSIGVSMSSLQAKGSPSQGCV